MAPLRLFRRRGQPEHPPAPFIVGVARSGTTLLRLMLDAHPELTVPPETHFIPRVTRAWGGGGTEGAIKAIVSHRRWPDFRLDESELRRRLNERAPAGAGDVLRAFYGLYAETQGKARWGDKSTNYVRHMRRIRGALPETRFVHLIRDGRDVALSLVAVYFGPTSIAEAAQKWREEISKARRQARHIDAYMEIRYEELVADPEPILRRVCEFSGLDWDPAMLGYRERAGERMAELNRDLERPEGTVTAAQRAAHQANVAKALSTDRSARWRAEMSDEDRAAFERQAGELLAELGYEA